MEVNEVGASLHQKRLLAFINHFVTRNIKFLNNFSCVCEEKLIAFESKVSKLEASLKILESQLNSIPDLHVSQQPKSPLPEEKIETVENQEIETAEKDTDPRYEKFFKMVHVGVPLQAVKLKMIQEGLDPNLLN